jgi:hypothetical protein
MQREGVREESLKTLDGHYEWNADLMCCRHCGRGQHVSLRHRPFQHASWCGKQSATALPWLCLVLAIDGSPLAAAASAAAKETPDAR